MPDRHARRPYAAIALLKAAAWSSALVLFAAGSTAQSVGVLPGVAGDTGFAEELTAALSSGMTVRDSSMAAAAFASVRVENIYNLTLADARRIGSVVGSDFIITVRSQTLRRAALDRDDFHESFAAVFAASSRTGRLVFWRLYSAEGPSPQLAQERLVQKAAAVAKDIAPALSSALASEARESAPPQLETVPEAASAAAKGLRPPVPYRRIKPEYTRDAYLYGVTATVDVEADIDEAGNITRIEVVRWAGFGLDESAVAAVRSMTWRPAERGGKTLPMRILLRYNFKKIEVDQQ